MFTNADIANDLKWHSIHKSQDEKTIHLIGSQSWKLIDEKWSSFAAKPCNLRFGLVANVFNPFCNLSASCSCWLAVLVNYNLPPRKCMEKGDLMLTLLIPSPK